MNDPSRVYEAAKGIDAGGPEDITPSTKAASGAIIVNPQKTEVAVPRININELLEPML